MKKVFLIVLIGMMLPIFGCLDVKPAVWDIDSDTRWEVWAEGKLVEMRKIEHPDCSNGVDCSGHSPIDLYVFDDGRKVKVQFIKNPGTIRAGQTGILYKRNLNNDDCNSWFQWIKKTDAPIKTPSKTAVPIITEPSALRIRLVDNNNDDVKWVECLKQQPERFTMVLIKFADETMSLGYRNHINEWKLAINKRQNKGGETIPTVDVIFWKSVNVE